MSLSSAGQAVGLALAPKLTGGFSMTSSLLIILNVLRKRTKGESNVYHRLMLGMSAADLIGSFMMALSTWPMPKESGMMWAVGNQGTCTLQGFMGQASVAATPIYSATLSIYYLLVVRYKWSERRMKSIEPLLHLPAIAWAWTTAVIGLPLDLFNNAALWCFMSPGPAGRGYHADLLRMLFFYIPIWICGMIIAMNLAIVTLHVRGVTSEAIRHSTVHLKVAKQGNHASPDDDDDDEDLSVGIPVDLEEDDRDRRDPQELDEQRSASQYNSHLVSYERDRSSTVQALYSNGFSGPSRRSMGEKRKNRYAKWRSKVAAQCLRYALAFYFAWLPISILRMKQMMDEDGVISYRLLMTSAINTPLLGVPNFLAFFYPKIVQLFKTRRPQMFAFLGLICVATRSSEACDDATDEAVPRASAHLHEKDSISPSQIESDHEGNEKKPMQSPLTGTVEPIAAHIDDDCSRSARPKNQKAEALGDQGARNNVSSITMSERSKFDPPGKMRAGRRGVFSAASSITISELDPFEDGVEFNVPHIEKLSSGPSSDERPGDVRPIPPARVRSGHRWPEFEAFDATRALDRECNRTSASTSASWVLDANPRLPRHPSSEVCEDDNSPMGEPLKDAVDKEATATPSTTTHTSLDFSPRVPPRMIAGHEEQELPQSNQSAVARRQSLEADHHAPGVQPHSFSEEGGGSSHLPAMYHTETSQHRTSKKLRRSSSDVVPRAPARVKSEAESDCDDNSLSGTTGEDGSVRGTFSDETPRLPAHVQSEYSATDFSFDIDHLGDNGTTTPDEVPRAMKRNVAER